MNNPNITDLDKQISANEAIGHWGGWAVVVGLFIEVALAIEFRHGKTDWENWAPVFADGLVALGVWAEVHFGRKASDAQKEKQGLSDLKIAELNNRATAAEHETELLRASTAPRRLSATQNGSLVAALYPLRGKKIRVRSYAIDGEAASLADQLINCLKTADAEVDNNILCQAPLGRLAYGVWVSGDDSEAADTILNALISEAGVAASQGEVQFDGGFFRPGDGTSVAALIFVGAKPIQS